MGDAIRLRAGALGGTIDGIVTDIGITYVRFDTGGSVMSVPNSQVLNAVVGPIPAGRQPRRPGPGRHRRQVGRSGRPRATTAGAAGTGLRGPEAEIAAAMKISRGALKSHPARGMSALRGPGADS